MTFTSRALSILLAVTLALTPAGCRDREEPGFAARAVEPKSDTFFMFDTINTVNVYDERMTEQIFRELEAAGRELDARLNRFSADSEIARVNAAAGKEAVTISADTCEVLRLALDMARRSQGKFDPTVGPLVDLWGIGTERATRPPESEIRKAAELVNYEWVELDDAACSVFLTKPGMSLDLGAVAKGYAGDRFAAFLKERGFRSAIIDLGGNVVAVGEKTDGKPWRIGIQNPENSRGEHVAVVEVRDQSVVTSGIYERYFIQDGVRYHHLLNPDDGYPTQNNLYSVTVVTARSAYADTLSTALFVMGLEDGLAFAESLPEAEALFLTKDREIHVTEGLRDRVTVTDGDYKLMP
jgi:FAD:protein FMN transferase